MTPETMLLLMKTDLGITTTLYDERLLQYLAAAKQEIEREGCVLSADSASDTNLQIMYAAWMWRRRDTGEGMPRMIRWLLNNRLFDTSGGDSDG